ncbi:MAG: hypothetical protein GY814_04105 [Gammaproteobacteria bacterium]|nr:hypothetical protein [Gammaproteobacteria bacterium]
MRKTETKLQKTILPGVPGYVQVSIVTLNRLYREGLCGLLARTPGLREIANAGNYPEFEERWNNVNLVVFFITNQEE